MDKKELFYRIRRNKNKKQEAIVLIADFLVTTREEAKIIYEQEFENV